MARSSALANFAAYLQHAGAAAVGRGTPCGSSLLVDARSPCRSRSRFAYALTRSCMPVEGAVSRLIALIADARAVAAVGDLADLLVRQPGRAQGLLDGVGFEIYGAPGIVIGRMLRDLPARADDPDHGAARSPTRGSTRRPIRSARRRGASSSRSRCRARKYGLISAAMVVFTLVDHRLRHPEGDRRQLQRAGDRHLQAGDRPAELPARRGRRPAAAGAGGADVRRRLATCSRQQSAMLTARAVPYRAAARRRGFDAAMLALLRADRRADAGDARAWRSSRRSSTYGRTTCRSACGHYTMGLVDAEVGDALPQQPEARPPAPRSSARRSSSSAPTCWRRRAGIDALRAGDPAAGRCCRWRCRGWCSASATSSSSTRRAIRSTACTSTHDAPRRCARSSTSTRPAT